jgi:ATP-dependent Lon protease
VLPIGGLKEKLLAAHRAGIKTALIPKENVRDLELLPEHVRQDMEIVPVESMDEVLDRALLRNCAPKQMKPKQGAMRATTQRKSAAERAG